MTFDRITVRAEQALRDAADAVRERELPLAAG